MANLHHKKLALDCSLLNIFLEAVVSMRVTNPQNSPPDKDLVQNSMSADDSDRIIVTGSAGFIGQHLLSALRHSTHEGTSGQTFSGYSAVGADICVQASTPEDTNKDAPAQGVRNDTEHWDVRQPVPATMASQGGNVVHLAGQAEALIPYDELATLLATNVTGVTNTLTQLAPSMFIFASSSAVYGHKSEEGVSELWRNVNPVGAYGMSKAMAELACRDWVEETGNRCVVLRFGNVVGARCRGFVPYLVKHAYTYPKAQTPALARGKGQIVRDYVPVEFVVKVIEAIIWGAWQPRTPDSGHHKNFQVFNVGVGRGLSNRYVADIVQDVLGRRGYALDVDWSMDRPTAESSCVVLSPSRIVESFGFDLPSETEVVASIESSANDWMSRFERQG